MIDIVNMIPSRDLQQALRESGREFTDMEKATLIHNMGLPLERRRELLQLLADETQDERLRAQIAFSFANEQHQDEWFRTVADGFAFGVQEVDEEDSYEAIDALCSTFELAFEYGLTMDSPFEIRKWRVLQALPTEGKIYPGDLGSMSFAADGTVKSKNLWITDENESDEGSMQFAPWPVGNEDQSWPNFLFFENRWVDLPNLYERGDIVRILPEGASDIDRVYDWAVVDTDATSWEETRQRVNDWLAKVEQGEESAQRVLADYYDMQVLVQIPYKDGMFSHDHINPMFLERATQEVQGNEAELQQMAQWAVRGECGLDWISHVLKKHMLTCSTNEER